MNTFFKKQTIKALVQENAELSEEVVVARRASEITAQLVTRQFEKMDEILKQFEENIADAKAKEQEISHINQMVQTVNSTLDFDEVAVSVKNALKSFFEFDLMAILLIDPTGKQLDMYRTDGGSLSEEKRAEYQALKISLDKDISINAYPVTRNKSLFLTGLHAGTEMRPADRKVWEMLPFKSLLCLPLGTQSRIIGTINFYRIEEDLKLTNESIGKVQNYVSHLGTAINNAHLAEEIRIALDEAKAKEQQLAHMNQVVKAVNSTLNLDEVMQSVMAALQDILKFNQAGIFLADDQNVELIPVMYFGEQIKEDRLQIFYKMKFPLEYEKSFVCETFLKKKSYCFSPVTEDLLEHFFPIDKQLYDINPVTSYLLYPLEVQQRVIGTIVFSDTSEVFSLTEENMPVSYTHLTLPTIRRGCRSRGGGGDV